LFFPLEIEVEPLLCKVGLIYRVQYPIISSSEVQLSTIECLSAEYLHTPWLPDQSENTYIGCMQ
jgi:hypothetical protein